MNVDSKGGSFLVQFTSEGGWSILKVPSRGWVICFNGKALKNGGTMLLFY